MSEEADWQNRLALIVDMMRDMSRQTDPQEMVRSYAQKIGQLVPLHRRLSLSRRGLSAPQYRITRSTTWREDVNPWKEKDRLPLFSGGLLAELIYGDEPVVIDDLELAPMSRPPNTWPGIARCWRSPCTTRAKPSIWSCSSRKSPAPSRTSRSPISSGAATSLDARRATWS